MKFFLLTCFSRPYSSHASEHGFPLLCPHVLSQIPDTLNPGMGCCILSDLHHSTSTALSNLKRQKWRKLQEDLITGVRSFSHSLIPTHFTTESNTNSLTYWFTGFNGGRGGIETAVSAGNIVPDRKWCRPELGRHAACVGLHVLSEDAN